MVVSKQNYSLAVVENEDTLFKCPVAVGKPMVIKPGEET